jgi:hypothetical protein
VSHQPAPLIALTLKFRVESFLGLKVFAAVTKVVQTVLHLLRVIAASMVLIVLLISTESHAAWPDHSITIIVPFPPGGATDLIGRVLAAELSRSLGENVRVENRG